MIEQSTNWVCFFWLLPMLASAGGTALGSLGTALGAGAAAGSTAAGLGSALGSAGTALGSLGGAMGGPAAGSGVTGMLGDMFKGLSSGGGGGGMQAPQINMADAQPKGMMGPSLEQLVQMRQQKKLGL